MSCLIGIRTNKFALLLSDKNPNDGLLTHTQNLSKTITLSNTLICYSGHISEADRFLSLAKERILLETTNHGLEIAPKICKNILAEIVYQNLRRQPVNVATIIAGKRSGMMENSNKIHLEENSSGTESQITENSAYEMYIVDEYGASLPADYACLGYARLFGYGLLDNLYSENMSLEDGLKAVKKVVSCIRSKICVGYSKFEISVVDEDGTRVLEFEAGEMVSE